MKEVALSFFIEGEAPFSSTLFYPKESLFRDLENKCRSSYSSLSLFEEEMTFGVMIGVPGFLSFPLQKTPYSPLLSEKGTVTLRFPLLSM